MLLERAQEASKKEIEAPGKEGSSGIGGPVGDILNGALDGLAGKRNRRSDSVFEAAAKSAARSIGSSFGRTLVRGILGSLFKGR